MSLRRLRGVARKEFLQVVRDPRSLAIAFVIPLVLLLLFGYAVTFDLRELPVAWHDGSRSPQSRDLLDALARSGYFAPGPPAARPADVALAIERGTARVGITIPPGFADRLGAGREAPVQVILDGSDANTATVALGYLRGVFRDYNVRLRPDARFAPPLDARTRVLFNPELKSLHFVIPGLIAVILMVMGALLTSLTVAREWERGTMEALAATPVTAAEFLVGKFIPYLAIGIGDILVTLAVGVGWFRVPLRGSPAVFFAGTLLFLACSLGMGLFISIRTRNQQVANQAAILGTFLPSLLLSGFIFPIANMPPLLRAVTYLVPARYFIPIARGVFLKGSGFAELGTEFLSLFLFGLVFFGLSMRSFTKEVG